MVYLVFDVDGVLIDSYRGVEVFYQKDLPKLINIDKCSVEFLLYTEYLGEAIGWLREDWWFKYIPGMNEDLFNKLITRYWERRIEFQKLLPGTKPILEKLRDMGVKLYSVSYRDDIYGLKRYRIDLEGLTSYFKQVIIAGEDVPSRIEGLKQVIREAGGDTVIYVDDKPLNLYRIKTVLGGDLVLIQYKFRPATYDFPWINPCSCFKTIDNLYQLYWIIREHIK